MDLQAEPDNIFHMQSGNFSIGRDFFMGLDGFDGQLQQYGGEDTDLFARAYLAGAYFLYSPEALAYQLVDARFIDLLAKARSANKASQIILRHYPTLAPRAVKGEPAALNLKGGIWQHFLQLSFSPGLLLKFLPLAERYCSDTVIFRLYNALFG